MSVGGEGRGDGRGKREGGGGGGEDIAECGSRKLRSNDRTMLRRLRNLSYVCGRSWVLFISLYWLRNGLYGFVCLFIHICFHLLIKILIYFFLLSSLCISVCLSVSISLTLSLFYLPTINFYLLRISHSLYVPARYFPRLPCLS